MFVEAAPFAALAVYEARLVPDHDVIVVQELLLRADPLQACLEFLEFLGCSSIVRLLGLPDLLLTPLALMV